MSDSFPDTLLVLTGIGLPPYSAIGAKQTLELIAAAKGQLIRDVNGNLENFAPAQFNKYRTTIDCADGEAPALDGVWPGHPVTVDCVVELSYLTAGGVPPQRTVVASRIEGDYTYYRLRLNCLLIDFTVSKDEWGAVTGWHLDLEEA